MILNVWKYSEMIKVVMVIRSIVLLIVHVSPAEFDKLLWERKYRHKIKHFTKNDYF